MKLGSFTPVRLICGGVAASTLMAAPAQAGMGFDMQLFADGEMVYEAPQTNAEVNNNGMTVHEGIASGDGWTFEYTATGDSASSINAHTSVTNDSGELQTFQMVVSMPIAPITPGSVIGGSVQGGVTSGDPGGGMLSSAPGTPIYQALADGSPIGEPAALLDDPSMLSVGGFESDSFDPEAFGEPIPSASGPAFDESMGIQLTFQLTPGEQASFTSTFVAVPAPTSAALFGLAGLGALRRRRR